MTRRKFNPDAEEALLLSENSSIDYKMGDRGPVAMDIMDFIPCSGNEHIMKRAQNTWSMLTSTEKHEYLRRSNSLSISGYELFMYDYIRLSQTGPGAEIKAMRRQRATRH